MIATCLVQIKQATLPIVGWRASRRGTVEMLVVALPSPDGLRYAGTVEWGLPAAVRATLPEALALLARPDCPLTPPLAIRHVSWVDPRLTVAVRFANWTADGLLRAPLAQTVALREAL